MPYHAQLSQDRLMDRVIFRGLRNGVFVDVGASDGVKLSNTYFFERDRAWTGLCIEPHPEVFRALAANRDVPCINAAISDTSGMLPFLRVTGADTKSTMFSGLVDTLQPSHVEFVEARLAERGGHADIITVPSRRLEDVLAEAGLREVHYLSVDVEGGELSVLRSLDFGATMVHAASIECSYAAPADVETATDDNLTVIARCRQDMLMVNPSSPYFASRHRLRRAVVFDEIRRDWIRRWKTVSREARRSVRRRTAHQQNVRQP